MKRILIWVLFLSLIVSLAGCDMVSEKSDGMNSIKYYGDIPGVIDEEIEAIEALKVKYGSFSYGHLVTTESFKQADGSYAGFTIEVCKLLSGLFDTQFSPKAYTEWVDLKSDIDNCATDFSGEFTHTAERMQIYEMTTPIAGRSINVYNLTSAPEITTETDINGLKVGFLDSAVATELIKELYPDISFEIVEVSDFLSAAEMLLSEEIDAFVTDGVADTMFEEYNNICSRDIFQFVYAPVSITTQNPEFRPVISVINKYLDAGGMETIFSLYRNGNYKYKKYKLNQSFSDEERAYLADLKLRNTEVNVALMHDAYPASFYNTVEKRYDGAAYDILSEVSELTGIVFNSDCMPVEKPLSDILAKLKSGEISMMPQLLYSESRKNDYIWSNTSYITTNFALLSKSDYPDLEPFQVYYARVGTVNKSVHEEVFNQLFPNHEKTIVYQTGNEGFDALESGEIDLLMLAETMLLVQTNYREKLGYKVNLTFEKNLDTLYGFNKDEVILRDIFDKSLAYIDIKGIEQNWLSRNFDYQSKMLRDSIPFIILFGVLLMAALFVVLIFYIKNRRLNKNLEETVKERTLELEQKTATLSTIYSSIPDLVFCKDVNSIYTSCNPSFENFSGISEDELIGKSDIEIFKIDGEMAKLFIEADKKVLSRQSSERIEELLTYPDGRQRLMETVKAPLIQNDEVIGIMGISRDITERKEMEHNLVEAKELAEQNSKAKSDFLSRMSHEMRTPMNAIIGMTSIGKSSNDIERKDYCLGKIESASTHLLGVINDVLDISKIEAGKFDLSNTSFSLEKMLIKITNVLNFRMEEKAQRFIIKIDRDVPQSIVSDEQRLSQVITNLIGNAIKFTPDNGSVSLFVRKVAEENEFYTIQFEVKDTGIGISEEQQKKLFNSFEQADGSVSRKYGGTGLGLAISKHIVEMMEGQIWIESKIGEGSSFFFNIRALEGDCQTNLPRSDINLSDLSILAVDDSEDVREYFLSLADSHKLQCEVAASGMEACEMIGAHGSYDVFFVDWKMDGMDGIEFTRWIKSKYSENSVVIMISSTEWSYIESEAKQAGVDRFIPKPLFASVIAECIQECVKTHQSAATDNSAELNKSERFDGMRLLLAEDVDINREIILAMLEPTGLQIDCAEDGGVAYRMFKDNPNYDVIFMDIHMPEVDGYTSTKMIRALSDPRAKTIPIIAMTANVFREDIERCLEAGMNAHIGKPIDIEDVMAKLRQHLPKKLR